MKDNSKIPETEKEYTDQENSKRKPLVISEQECYQRIDPDTGEIIGAPITVDVAIREIPRSGFYISYLAAVISTIESIGNKKMQVVKYILKNMDSNNKLSETVREISKGTGCSLRTVQETLKTLEDCKIIARKTGTVMITPKLAHKGNAKKERFLMTKFFEIERSKTDDNADDNAEK